MQITNRAHAVKISFALSLRDAFFHVYYYVTTWFLVQFLGIEKKVKSSRMSIVLWSKLFEFGHSAKSWHIWHEVLREKMPLCKVEIWTIWRNTNLGGIFSLLLGLGTLAIRPQGCCWNYLKTFEFRKRLLSDYKTYNGCRNEFWPRERQMFKNTSNVFSASRTKGKKN